MLKTDDKEWFPTWLQVLTPLNQSDSKTDASQDELTAHRVGNKVDVLGKDLVKKIEDTKSDNEQFKEDQLKFRESVNQFMSEMRLYMEDGGKTELSTEQRVQKGKESMKRLSMKQRLLGSKKG